jgi:hypothetical protein
MIALAFAGPIIVCCIGAYLRWQLGDGASASVTSRSASRRGLLSDAGDFLAAETFGRSGNPPLCVASLGDRRSPGLPQGPGVYVAGCRDAQAEGREAAIRGQMLADRIINGRFEARRTLRRGRKGALDVIVVGANPLGVSAARHLVHAGLRVLMVDRHGDAPSVSMTDVIGSDCVGARRADGQARLPLLTGHAISAVAERADGMLEVQAERAAWYTANVIFASNESLASAGRAAPPRRSPAPQAA